MTLPGRDLARISSALAANEDYFEELRARERTDAATMLQAAARRCAACGEVAQRRATVRAEQDCARARACAAAAVAASQAAQEAVQRDCERARHDSR